MEDSSKTKEELFKELETAKKRIAEASGEKIVGWGLTYSGDETLFEFLGFIHLAVPKILRINPPFHGYAGESLKSPRSGLFKYSDSSET